MQDLWEIGEAKMTTKIKRQVFYSFHFDNDVMRVQQIRNLGVIDGDEPVSPNEWEKLKKQDSGVKKWIDSNMSYKSCVVVLIGKETAKRPWVLYEIGKAWADGRGLVGIYVHNLKHPTTGACTAGSNPFDNVVVQSGSDKGKKLSSLVSCYNPKTSDAYNDIKANIGDWIEAAIASRK